MWKRDDNIVQKEFFFSSFYCYIWTIPCSVFLQLRGQFRNKCDLYFMLRGVCMCIYVYVLFFYIDMHSRYVYN